MKVIDIMSSDVTSLALDASVMEAAQLMKQYDVGSIPICDKKKVVGIVTDRDIAIRSVAESQDIKHQKVSEIMSTNPVVGTVDMNVQEVSKLMSEKQIRRLPIVKDNDLVGIVALGDLAIEPKLQDKAETALNSISKTKTY